LPQQFHCVTQLFAANAKPVERLIGTDIGARGEKTFEDGIQTQACPFGEWEPTSAQPATWPHAGEEVRHALLKSAVALETIAQVRERMLSFGPSDSRLLGPC
jgi:hypothetical protein